jgi:predicted transcriptional regulator
MPRMFFGSLPWLPRAAGAPGDPLGGLLGSLERQVMDVMWAGGALLVRDVQGRLERPVAYTTVMTTLDRLYKKGLVTRERQGRAFSYTAARSREQLHAAVAARMLSNALSGGAETALPVLSNLVDAVSAGDGGAELLDRLEAVVRERRRQLQEGGE